MGEIDGLDFGRGRSAFINVAVMLHGVDDYELAFFCHEEVDIGRIEGGSIGEAGKHRRFRQLKCGWFLAEVAIGCWAYSVVVGTVVNRIEVKLENLIFTVIGLDVECQQQFFDFASVRLFVGEEEIFDQLLCDGAGAFFDLAVLDIDQRSPHDALQVEAVMAVKAGVFYGNDGLLHRLGDIAYFDVILVIDAAVNSSFDEEETADAVGCADCNLRVCLLDGWKLGFDLGQEVADMLPGFG